MTAGYKGKVAMSAGTYYAPYIPVSMTWQSYLRRLSNGINGVSDRSKVLTAEDIIARAEKYMQIRYPGPYTVEQFYNAEKMKWDVRLKFNDPKEELFWLLKWS